MLFLCLNGWKSGWESGVWTLEPWKIGYRTNPPSPRQQTAVGLLSHPYKGAKLFELTAINEFSSLCMLRSSWNSPNDGCSAYNFLDLLKKPKKKLKDPRIVRPKIKDHPKSKTVFVAPGVTISHFSVLSPASDWKHDMFDEMAKQAPGCLPGDSGMTCKLF